MESVSFLNTRVIFCIKYVHSRENSKHGHELPSLSFFIKYPPLPQGKNKSQKKEAQKMLKLPCTNDNKIRLPGTSPSSFTTIAFELLSMLCFSQGSCAFVHKPHVWWHWTFTCRYRLFKKWGRKGNWGKAILHFYCGLFPLICNRNKDPLVFYCSPLWGC